MCAPLLSVGGSVGRSVCLSVVVVDVPMVFLVQDELVTTTTTTLLTSHMLLI